MGGQFAFLKAYFIDKTGLFEKTRRRGRPVIVEFWAPWCGPCRVLGPDLEKSAKEFSGRVDLLKINADDHPELWRELRIFDIPTILAADWRVVSAARLPLAVIQNN